MLPQAWLDWFSWFIARAQAYFLIDPVKIYLLPGLVLIVLFAIAQKDWRARYLSRNFANDTFYYFLFYSSVYRFLVCRERPRPARPRQKSRLRCSRRWLRGPGINIAIVGR
jgi:hypothetical protein